MTQWRLFSEGETPYFTTPEFFAAHPWVDPAHQIGHTERMNMTEQVVRTFLERTPAVNRVTELGCGDGCLMDRLKDMHSVTFKGYDACVGSLEQARRKGLVVYEADIRDVCTQGAQLIIACETVEHMEDPHSFIAGIESDWLVVTSPSAETDTWHYEHHAWAWDVDGYSTLVQDAGWNIVEHVTCDAPQVNFGGITRHQQFQCILAEKTPS